MESLVERAEAALDESRPRREGRAQWVAGLPVVMPLGGTLARLIWTYRGEARELRLGAAAAKSAAETLVSLARTNAGLPYTDLAARLGLAPEALSELRSSGLVVV